MTGDSEKVGGILKGTREAKSVSLEEISNRSKISRRFLEAIERGDYSLLPSDMFIRSFIRQYAQIVGLEGEEMVELYRRERGFKERELVTEPSARSFRSSWIMLILIPSIAVIVWVGAKYLSLRSESSYVTETAISDTTPQKPPGSTEILLQFTDRCWMSVELDGKKIYEGIRSPGDELRYSLRNKLTIRAGDGGAFQLSKNGEKISYEGIRGQPVDVTITPQGVVYGKH